MQETILILLILMSIIYIGGQIDLSFLEDESDLEIRLAQKRKGLKLGKLIDLENS